eukprot:CAMPEP_0182558664 /NCGR_PEP_ID=MMETSP1324-20130603/2086_1 /TAXON_ID=236786 /ORGANISM="Florenciella sp., Strain RCC1587" /LENGTH=169 /DNA_ID=CAMNT_0024770847 /DNA_START=138 /DNA_END=643 /DNA_ORIENTATION=+
MKNWRHICASSSGTTHHSAGTAGSPSLSSSGSYTTHLEPSVSNVYPSHTESEGGLGAVAFSSGLGAVVVVVAAAAVATAAAAGACGTGGTDDGVGDCGGAAAAAPDDDDDPGACPQAISSFHTRSTAAVGGRSAELLEYLLLKNLEPLALTILSLAAFIRSYSLASSVR